MRLPDGAAADLIAIVYGAVQTLGTMPDGTVNVEAGFRYALVVGVVCGGLQILNGIAVKERVKHELGNSTGESKQLLRHDVTSA